MRNIRQTQIEKYSIKYLTSIPQNCQGHEKQKTETATNQRRPKET
jgi:hypothetical protein